MTRQFLDTHEGERRPSQTIVALGIGALLLVAAGVVAVTASVAHADSEEKGQSSTAKATQAVAAIDQRALECSGPLIVTRNSTSESILTDEVPTERDALSLMKVTAQVADFPAVESVTAEDKTGKSASTGVLRFIGYDAEGKTVTIADVEATEKGFVLSAFSACSGSGIKEPDEGLQRRPLAEVIEEGKEQ